MSPTIVICGYGAGISNAVAQRFGAEGFQVALVARNETKLARAAKDLGDAGVPSRGFVCNLAEPAAVKQCFERVRAEFGAITIVHWNASAPLAGDVTACDPNEVRACLDVAVTGLVAGVQAALPDLQASQGRGAVLVTGGGLALFDPRTDAMAAQFGAMGLAVAKAAQHKLVGVLHAKLKPLGVYVGEVTVLGLVKGTAHDRGQAKLDPSVIAQRFFELYRERRDNYTQVS